MLHDALFSGGAIGVGVHGDPSIFMWDLAWVPFALSHHLNPLITTYQNYPDGANLMWNTSIIFPALVMTPITALVGAVESYNILSVMAITLSAWCAFLAIRRYTSRSVPAWVGGLLYGFSPYMYDQSLGHLHTSIAVFPPLALLLAHELLVRRRMPPWLLGGLAGAAAAAQLLTGEELLAITALMALVTVIVAAGVHRRTLHEYLSLHGGYVAKAALVAGGVFLVLAAVPLYVQFFGPLRVPGLLQPFNVYEASGASFVIPTPHQLIALLGRTTTPDSDAFIGIPLMLLAVAAVIWLRRERIVAVTAVVIVITMVLSLGGRLHLGTEATGIRLPWTIFNHVPVLQNVLPIRLMVFAYLGLGVLVAVFFDRTLDKPRLASRALLCSAVVAALVPLLPALPYPSARWDVPPFFTGNATARIPPDTSALVTPYLAEDPRLWQAAASLKFRTADGWEFVPGPSGPVFGEAADPLTPVLYDLGELNQPAPATISAADQQRYADDLRRRRVQTIIIGPSIGRLQLIDFFTNLLGRPPQSLGGVAVWYDVHV
jgi:hypothetical protein